MSSQASTGPRVPAGWDSSNAAATLSCPEIAAPVTHAGPRLQEEALRLVEAPTGRIEGDNRQLRVLGQMAAGKVEELITQTYIGDHEKMKLAVDNLAVTLQGLQIEMARLTEASREAQLAERGKPGRFQGAQKLKDRLLLVLDTERAVDLAVEMTA
jgi:hypothetical protein